MTKDRPLESDTLRRNALRLLRPTRAELSYRLPSTIGQRFEAVLHTGWLETALSDAIERLKSELARYSAERQMVLDEQHEVAVARWRATEATEIEKPEA